MESLRHTERIYLCGTTDNTLQPHRGDLRIRRVGRLSGQMVEFLRRFQRNCWRVPSPRSYLVRRSAHGGRRYGYNDNNELDEWCNHQLFRSPKNPSAGATISLARPVAGLAEGANRRRLQPE